MRCECCNNMLSDKDATARFAESGNFVNMCETCRGFLPKNIAVITRSDLERQEREAEDADFNPDDLESFYGDEE